MFGKICRVAALVLSTAAALSPMTAPVSLVVAASAAIPLVAATAAADGAVGQLTEYGASLPDGSPVPAGPWVGINDGNVNGATIGVSMPADSGGGWSQTATLSPPSGMTFASVAAIRSFNAPVSGALWQPRIQTTWENRGWWGGGYGGDSGSGAVSVTSPSSLSINVSCATGMGGSDPNPRCSGGGYWDATRLTYVLNDPNQPTGSLVNGGGALLDGSWHTSGSAVLTINAQDGTGESGVYRAFIKNGATKYYTSVDPSFTRCQDPVPNGNAYAFAASATSLAPCRTAAQDYSPTFDLTALGDGTHTGLDLGIEDASGREYMLASNRTIKVNGPLGALSDPGTTGPGGCVYQDDGTTCILPMANTVVPGISGTAKVGQVLTASKGTWTGAVGATFSYQWERNVSGAWTAIANATSSSYTLTADDLTFTVRVKVTATVGVSSQSAYSTASGAVAAAERDGSGINGGPGGGGGGPTTSTKKDDGDPPAKAPEEGPKGDPPATTTVAAPKSDPNGAPATRDATVSATFAGNGQRAIAAKYTAGLRVRGTLKSAKGTPIANATVILSARNNTPGSNTVKLTTATTDSKGRYETTIPRGPSRKITVSYTAFSGDIDPADTASLSVKVKAAAKLVTNVRTVRVGHGLQLRGRLAHRTQGGVMVLIGAMDGGQWRSFAHVRTDRQGRFHYTYKFKAGSEGRTFYFSVLVDDRVYPFAAGFSNDVRVRVAR
jgi:hypothetical protein